MSAERSAGKNRLKQAFSRARAAGRGGLKWSFRAAAAGLGASIAVSAGAVHWGQARLSEPVAVYLARTGQDPRILAGVKGPEIRVYRRGALVPFHQAGRAGQKALQEIWEDPEAGLPAKLLGTALGALPAYAVTLGGALASEALDDPFDAYALPPGDAPDDACYIRPPGPSSLAEAMQALSGLPAEDMRPIPGPANEGRDAVMAHEAVHCGQAPDADLSSVALGNEMEADIEGMGRVAAIEGDDHVMTALKYARAVGVFSQPDSFDRDHATALALDAAQRGKPLPEREEVYYANGQLREMVESRLRGFDPEQADMPYYRAVYEAMQDILAAPGPYAPPLVRRAARLYIEGVDFLTGPPAHGARSAPRAKPPVPRPVRRPH
jgi:hypothetical protein